MPAGRPMKWDTIEEVQTACDTYFEECVTNKTPLTITGLAIALGTCRQTLLNYEVKEEFMDTIKGAKLKVENYAELQVYNGKNAAGPIFILKNHGWSDKQEIDMTAKVGDLESLTPEELDNLIQEEIRKMEE